MRILMPILVLVSGGDLIAQSSRSQPVKTCSQVSLARPGFGVAYRATVRNDDYKLSLTIPKRLTGWGADPVAPFHGFTIFLPSDERRASCVMFEIYLRIDLASREARHRGVKVKTGDLIGWKEEATGTKNGTEFTNVTVRFSVARGQEVDDGTVRLVTPTKDIRRDRPIFEAFLSQIKFDHQ